MKRKYSSKKLKIAPLLVIRYGFCRIVTTLRYRKNIERRDQIKSLQREIFKDKVLALFQRKFKKDIRESKTRILLDEKNHIHENGNYVWTYWAQGIEAAPDVIKICVRSICEYFKKTENGGG